jgi:4-amino-4-deoxy-L-arabinose transferase-like glycosyltransferase
MKKKIISNFSDQPKASKPFHVHFFLLLFVLVAVFFLRLPLLDMPLERDEGGFAYIAKMMLGDKNLYTDLHDSKLPLLYIIYAVIIKLFGYNAIGIHLGLLVFNTATILVIYYYISSIFNRNIGLMTSILYAIQSLNPLMLGFATHATQLLMLPVSVGLWLHYRAIKSEKIGLMFLAGFFIGLSFLIKQQVIGFIFFGLIYNIYNDFQAKKSLKHVFLTAISFGLGTITP